MSMTAKNGTNNSSIRSNSSAMRNGNGTPLPIPTGPVTPVFNGLTEVKSKFIAEFRRFSINGNNLRTFVEFYAFLEKIHRLNDTPFLVGYSDPQGDLLPINNDDNFIKALTTAKPLLKLVVQKLDECNENTFGTVQPKKKGILSTYLGAPPSKTLSAIPKHIGLPQDFRRVSAIIDVDIIPESHRRVKLHKHGSDKPLGFYIRDGTSVRVTPHGLEKVPGIFISRLVPGGLAESTGLLDVNDEVLEVNGIEVQGKSLDQVTDMMVANSANLIITVKPANQRNTLSGGKRRPHSVVSVSPSAISLSPSQASLSEAGSIGDLSDEDEVQDMVEKTSQLQTSDAASAAMVAGTLNENASTGAETSAPSAPAPSNGAIHIGGGGGDTAPPATKFEPTIEIAPSTTTVVSEKGDAESAIQVVVENGGGAVIEERYDDGDDQQQITMVTL